MADTYLGGENDEVNRVTPKDYERFFNEKYMYFILATLVIFLLVVKFMVVA